ncbi:MAG: Ig-like domain-containing protein [Bacteroidetes bacterium]|nr:Ig-like domain-containing protein [Bacteroidota bacterium]
MKLRNGLLFFSLYALLVIGAIGHTGCANIIPPTGGPRDTLPPRLLFVTPNDTAKRVTTNKIVFTFDEYIDPKDIRTELIVSPVQKIDPIVDSKLRVLTVKMKDTLQPNTTYTLNFGKSIRDYNEGNILRDFSYTFSTGDHIDQGTFTGKVLIAVTGKADSTLIVVLHTKFEDSTVAKDRPRYMARVDSTGQFAFRNIQPGSYAVYAMKDEGGTHKYLSKAQLFAFADAPVDIKESTNPITLYAYTEAADSKPKTTTTAAPAPANRRTTARDRERDRRLQLQTNVANNQFDVLDTFRITFATGLKVFDSTQLRFTDEYFRDIDVRRYRYARDTTNKIVSLVYAWPTDTKFNLIIPKTFGQDSAGRKLLKDDTVSFRTKKDIDYGEIRVRVLNINLSRHPVLQLVQSDVVKFSFPFNARREVRKLLFPPGEYEMRILYDTNGNLTWDTGQFFEKKRQPEVVAPVSRKLTVKANWDNDLDFSL